MTFCEPGNKKSEEGCAGSTKVHAYKDQLTRDYPSFGQIRKVINENSKPICVKITFNFLGSFLAESQLCTFFFSIL